MEAVTIITASEFRANQKRYFELAESTPVYVTRAGKMPVMISSAPIAELSAKEIEAIKKGLEDIKAGHTTEVDVNNLWESIL